MGNEKIRFGRSDVEVCKRGHSLSQLLESSPDLRDRQTHLIQESTELMKIFGAILDKKTKAATT